MRSTREQHFNQCQFKRRYGPGKAYCRIHDPDRRAAIEQAKQTTQAKQTAEDDATVKRGRWLANRLGLRQVHCDVTIRFPSRPLPRLVVPFEQLERLIARMKP